jgi:Tol biopolymer transport system component
MDLVGSNPLNLTSHPAIDRDGVISPDGRWIAFVSNRSGSFEIWVQRLDGSGLRQVTSDGDTCAEPAWSPDSRKIAFSFYTGTNWDIAFVNLNTNTWQRFTDSPADDRFPCWHPDNKTIAFASLRTISDGMEGAGAGAFLNGESGASGDGGAVFNIWRGSSLTPLLNQVPVTSSGTIASYDPAYSKDGSLMTLTRSGDGDGENVWIMNPDGGGLVKLTFGGDRYWSQFTPDLQSIVYTWSGDIAIMGTNGSGQVKLTNTAGVDYRPSAARTN